MRALKILVLSRAVVLVVGFGFLIWGLTGRGGAPSRPSVPRGEAADFGQVKVPIPGGAKIEQMLSVDGRLALRVSGTAGDRVIVLDVKDGHVVGEFVAEALP